MKPLTEDDLRDLVAQSLGELISETEEAGEKIMLDADGVDAVCQKIASRIGWTITPQKLTAEDIAEQRIRYTATLMQYTTTIRVDDESGGGT